jgi:hypothetical protein
MTSITKCLKNDCRAMANLWPSCSSRRFSPLAVEPSIKMPRACKSSAKPCWARCSLNSSGARSTRALAWATSKRCLKAWSGIRFGVGSFRWMLNERPSFFVGASSPLRMTLAHCSPLNRGRVSYTLIFSTLRLQLGEVISQMGLSLSKKLAQESANALADMKATENGHGLDDVRVYFAQLKSHRQGQSERPATLRPKSMR